MSTQETRDKPAQAVIIPFPKPSTTVKDAISPPMRACMNVLAKEKCPFRRKNISCALTGAACLFERGLSCKYFLNSVLPADKTLLREFQKAVQRATGKPYQSEKKPNPLLKQHKGEITALARRECANCDRDNYCLLTDAPCSPITPQGELCGYFCECVLPLDKALQAKVTPGEYKKRDLIKPCAACGKPFLATNNRAKYCDECRADARREKDAERKRISRQGA